jgi:hypothetical protein
MLMVHHVAGSGLNSWLVVGAAAMIAACAQTISGFGMNLILAPPSSPCRAPPRSA